MPTAFVKGFRCFLEGAHLVLSPTLRPFILMPLAINMVLFAALTWWVIGQFDGWLASMLSFLPDWLVELSRGVIAFLMGLLLVMAMGVSFLPLTSLVAAPFNGLLAERAQLLLAGVAPPDESIPALVVRSVWRELRKLGYFLPRALGVLVLALLLSWIPLVNALVPVLTFVWGAWFMALQYLDYCEDSQQRGFESTLGLMRSQRTHSLGFGAGVMMAAMVPVLNWFVMPVAVCGATRLWVQLQQSEVV
jgi:CysZ protein